MKYANALAFGETRRKKETQRHGGFLGELMTIASTVLISPRLRVRRKQ